MSRLTSALGSFMSATNENYAALANVKFDFSLIKMEAPVEFSGVVSALSTMRRVDAEQGPSHKTARRLGALFEDVVPTTPKLISAYGLRMSEIMNTPGVNDIGADQHGPFGPYVGADGTSLWAAATSGIPALGVYLLSCLLARAWDSKTATAIWVEIVAARRKEIEEGVQNNHNVSASAIVGAYQDITRKDLQSWDSSARAWLRRADRAKNWSQCQLELVVKNINTPIAGGPSTYEKVISVWKRSMLAVEQLLSGKPQDIVDGSVFLAFSAWHLFPDLIVLGAEPKKVEFKDGLIPSGGVGTVGLVSNTTEEDGVRWSLALSHLQYYGEPVLVRSDQESSRLTFAQLRVVALGGLFGSWKLSHRDFLLAADWIKLLWTRMDVAEDHTKDNGYSEFEWLRQIAAAADQLLAVEDENHQQNFQLLKHGSRRGKSFLSGPGYISSPFFGLLNTLTLHGLLEDLDEDCGINYLREVAGRLGLNVSDSVICSAHNTSYHHGSGAADYFELATTQPAGPDGYMRWICPNSMVTTNKSPRFSPDSEGQLKDERFDTQDRMDYISARGEKCERRVTGLEQAVRGHGFAWADPPRLYQQDNPVDPVNLGHPRKKARVTANFQHIVGDQRFGLYIRRERNDSDKSWETYKKRAKSETAKTGRLLAAVQEFKAAKLVPERLRDYMCALTSVSEEQVKDNSLSAPGVSLVAEPHRFHTDFSKSLYALESCSMIYGHLSKATISLKPLLQPLHKLAWFESLFSRWKVPRKKASTRPTKSALLTSQHPPLPDRFESFGCIAWFDSGTVDLTREDLQYAFALCSEDTIYVPAVVLSDPFRRVPEYEMRSITGNVSRAGISILVSPIEPRVRDLSDSYNVVTHETYDRKRENNFRETSLHLSFTEWIIPLATEGSRTIDHDAQIIEAVVSIRDRGQWVADIDILEVDFQDMTRFKSSVCCNENHDQDADFDYTSIDSWEELLDEPGTVGIFRAHGNWAARLAAVSILSRKEIGGHNFGVLGPEPFCLKCLEEEFEKPGWDMQEYESTLPSFCID
ncbi:uncharacterized protein M421DRAFT_423813 [Didymella exigua CBS 183.55]|uniref:Uncharacterized protein n=1 Tax=Didymella exigua CBS 183.55 TaxID=1150837 RepID=A0A6A5RD08_9PLEO|nr:uncharacterized protein M421DRAFT_423813 [Didymella exigua CBS 183.55]KAF1925279.1 hypothetical protein M421DRAFT_423813 [Didymella exigua CBS 183.55]